MSAPLDSLDDRLAEMQANGDKWLTIAAVRAMLAAAPKAAPAADWTTPTSWAQRFIDGIERICGKRPSAGIVAAWLDKSVEDNRLQNFCSEHGPAWAQGIIIIDAAHLMADTPAEGADHEDAPKAAPAVAPNLSDLAVQRRLAAQWGYVPAQGEPVATLHADGHWTHPAGRDPLDQFSGKVRLDVYAATKAAPQEFTPAEVVRMNEAGRIKVSPQGGGAA